MHRHFACALCAGIGIAALSASAYADVTYTLETLSSESLKPTASGEPAPTINLSFTVNGPISISASSDFADNSQHVPPSTPVTFSFPPQLTAFSLTDDMLDITPASFVSTKGPGSEVSDGAPGAPDWTFALQANTFGSADLSLFFINSIDSAEISGKDSSIADFETGAPTTFFYADDGNNFGEYTGILVATVPEPSSLMLLLSGIGVLGAAAVARRIRPATTAV
jgi:PEP-CTERM motif